LEALQTREGNNIAKTDIFVKLFYILRIAVAVFNVSKNVSK